MISERKKKNWLTRTPCRVWRAITSHVFFSLFSVPPFVTLSSLFFAGFHFIVTWLFGSDSGSDTYKGPHEEQRTTVTDYMVNLSPQTCTWDCCEAILFWAQQFIMFFQKAFLVVTSSTGRILIHASIPHNFYIFSRASESHRISRKLILKFGSFRKGAKSLEKGSSVISLDS